ncbi:MAG: hypothetical protein GX316_06695 [Firmicutes bacterium]|nr:hypothetical protein [Bacillota bacterium]
MSKKSIVLRSRGFVDSRQAVKLSHYRLSVIIGMPIGLLIALWSNPTAVSLWRGGIFLIFGEAVRFWSAGYINAWHKALIDRRLPVLGPYGLMRNPCHMGSFLIGLGVAMMSGLRSAYFILVGFTLIGLVYFIPQEEKFLKEKFGAAYEANSRLLARYLPNWRQLARWWKARREPHAHEGFQSMEAWLFERHIIIFLIGIISAMIVRWRF